MRLRLDTTLPLAALVFLLALVPVSVAGKKPSCTRRSPCDTTPPTIVISTPSEGATLAGATVGSGVASDNVVLSAVHVRIDQGPWIAVSGSASWTAALETTAYQDGAHVLTARATDGSGNVATTSLGIAIDNAPEPAPPPSSSPPPLPPAPQTAVTAPPMVSGTIGGYAFRETDRDGVFETDETALVGHRIHLWDAHGVYLRNVETDTRGWYEFGGLPDGTYRVEYAPQSWFQIRGELVPVSTGSLDPGRLVTLVQVARADIGWRPILRSTDPAAPISTFSGSNGLTVKSYNDVVLAKDVYDRLLSGSLVGPEAAHVTVRLDLVQAGSTSTSASRSNGGPYEHYIAVSDVTYLGWLEGDNELFHEYGHAWSLYYAYVVQQDPSLSSYLEARGLNSDPRVNTSYGWNVGELIAEDYRQLFGSASAREASQMNSEIPAAADVPGLRTFLSEALVRPAAA